MRLSLVLTAAALVGAVVVPSLPSAAAVPGGPTAAQGPNVVIRECSRLTQRCTPYNVTGTSYDPRVPSVYSTRWVWTWI